MQRQVIIGLAGLVLLTACLPQLQQDDDPYPREALEATESLLMATNKLALIHPMVSVEDHPHNEEAKSLATSLYFEMEDAAKTMAPVVEHYGQSQPLSEQLMINFALQKLLSGLSESFYIKTAQSGLSSLSMSLPNPMHSSDATVADFHAGQFVDISNRALGVLRAIEVTAVNNETPHDRIVSLLIRIQSFSAARSGALIQNVLHSQPVDDIELATADKYSLGVTFMHSELEPLQTIYGKTAPPESSSSLANRRLAEVMEINDMFVGQLYEAYDLSVEAVEYNEKTVDFESYEISALQLYNWLIEFHETIEVLKADAKAQLQ